MKNGQEFSDISKEMKNNQELDNLPCDHTFHEVCLVLFNC